MKSQEVERIQAYKGDLIEEQWKPSLLAEKPYIDWFYYWEFRELLVAGNLTYLRPLEMGQAIAKKTLYQHERLAGYYYSASVLLNLAAEG